MIVLVFSSPCCVALRRVVAYLLNVSALHRSLRALPDNENTAHNVFRGRVVVDGNGVEGFCKNGERTNSRHSRRYCLSFPPLAGMMNNVAKRESS